MGPLLPGHRRRARAGGHRRRVSERILLTLATGTGKTFIAFQIAWKLFQSRWNLSREPEPTRRPRILFLADRNILADQAYNAFSAFPRMRWCASRPTTSARRARCRRTAASSSRSSRPS
jgi:type I restriction enzyme R subunit